MDSAAAPQPHNLPPGPCAVSSGTECLTIPEIMGIVQRLFLKSDFTLVEETLRMRETMLRAEVASTFCRELSEKEAENAVLRAKCHKACTELSAIMVELKKLGLQKLLRKHEVGQEHSSPRVSDAEYERLKREMEAERRTWLQKEEAYKKKIANLEHEHNSAELLQDKLQTWQEKEDAVNRRIATLHCELNSEDLDGKTNAENRSSSALLQAERRNWLEKEEFYNRRIKKLECELKSLAQGHNGVDDLCLQAKNELLDTIQRLKDSEEVIMKLQKESQQFCDLKVEYELLKEELNEGKRNEEVYEERILELEKELKETDKANAKFLELTSAYMELEDEKDAAEKEAMKWKRKYEELEARTPDTLVDRKDLKNIFAPLNPCQAGLAAEDRTKEKLKDSLVTEVNRISRGRVIEISDSDGEGEGSRPCKRLHK